MPTKCFLENHFQLDVKEIGYEGVSWIHLDQVKVHWL